VTDLVRLSRVTTALQLCFSRRTCRPAESLPPLDFDQIIASWTEYFGPGLRGTVTVFRSADEVFSGLIAVLVVPSDRQPFILRYASEQRLQEAGLNFRDWADLGAS
jgi:hypothetical protein